MANKPARAVKRRVKNPETFRERASKASATSDQPSKRTYPFRLLSKFLRPVSSKTRAGTSRVFRQTPLRWLRQPLRLLGKILLPVYLRNSWRELRQVQWPTRSQSFRLTFAVLFFALIFGVSIAGVDWVLNQAFKTIILK